MLHYGLDVDKRYTTYCVMDDGGRVLKEGRCPNDGIPLLEVFSWKKREDRRAVMEAGGNWYHLYHLLEPLVGELLLAHPLRVCAIAAARVKTDAIDARTLAHLLRSDLIPPAYVPPMPVRELREMLRYRLDLVKQRTSLKNRVHALLAKEGLSSPVSDLFGRRGREWLNPLPLSPSKCYRLNGYLEVLDCLTERIRDADTLVRSQAERDRQAGLLMTIPGIGPLTALTIIAEIGEVDRFPDAKHLVSYPGLAPRVRSSGGRTRMGHITKQGPSALRWAVIEATHIAVRRPGRLQDSYNRLRRGKNGSVAITACARQLLASIYHMLIRGEAFRSVAAPMPS